MLSGEAPTSAWPLRMNEVAESLPPGSKWNWAFRAKGDRAPFRFLKLNKNPPQNAVSENDHCLQLFTIPWADWAQPGGSSAPYAVS